MNRNRSSSSSPLKALAIGLAVVAGMLAVEAEAGWHHRYGCGSCGGRHHHGRHHASHGSWGSSGGSSGSHGGSSGSAAAAPAAAPKAAAPATKSADQGSSQPALLVVRVPADAKLFINGESTSLAGGQRTFAAAGLDGDARHEYEVRMIVGEGAEAREETKRVWLVNGETQTLAFTPDGEGTTVAMR